MKKILNCYKENFIYIFFSYIFTFFLVCSYVFENLNGFTNFVRLLLVLIASAIITPLTSWLIIQLSKVRIFCVPKFFHKYENLFQYKLFYLLSIFTLQLPIFLAFYPGFCYYDINTQVEQYQIPYYVLNHPLLHTLFIGYFKNLFANANIGYAISTLIQMVFVDGAMAYSLHYIYQEKRCLLLCTLGILFYGIFPVNSILTISTTKDILFAAFSLIYVIDIIRICTENIKWTLSVRFILNAILMLLFRNNAIYAFLPSIMIIAFCVKKCHYLKRHLLLYCLIILGYFAINSSLISILHAVPGSIKETMSIPSQQLARIYLNTSNNSVKDKILTYIPEPEEYCYYLSDAVKEQLPFDTVDSACKHFLLDTAIYDLQYPIIALDAAFYNTQGYWDIFHSPYQADHFYLVSQDYRGGANLDSKWMSICNLYSQLFYRFDKLQATPLVLFGGISLYIWLFLFFFIKSIKEKNSPFLCGCIFPFFYLLTLLLGPGAIIRYAFVFILLTPVLISLLYRDTTT